MKSQAGIPKNARISESGSGSTTLAILRSMPGWLTLLLVLGLPAIEVQASSVWMGTTKTPGSARIALQFTDPDAANHNQRFYRVLLGP